MELGPEPPHRRRLLFAGSPPPAPPAAARPLLGALAAGGLSPVTTLTVTMDLLKGLGRECEQPEVKNSSSLQRMGSSESTDSGFCLDSPGPLDSKENLGNPLRRIHSLPQKLLGCSPALKRSHSDVLDHDLFQLIDQDENKENLSANERESGEPGNLVPLFMPQSRVTTALSDEDDGFMDLLDGENLKNDEGTPSCMASLWTAPLVTRRVTNLGNRGQLADSPSTCSPSSRPVLKRPERWPEDSEDSRASSKRRRSAGGSGLQKTPEGKDGPRASCMPGKRCAMEPQFFSSVVAPYAGLTNRRKNISEHMKENEKFKKNV